MKTTWWKTKLSVMRCQLQIVGQCKTDYEQLTIFAPLGLQFFEIRFT